MGRARSWFLAGLGALGGMGVGAFRGLLWIHRSQDWSHETLWLAWSRLASRAAWFGLVGLAAGVLLAALFALPPLARRFPVRDFMARAGQVSLLLLAALSAWTLIGPACGSLRAGKRPSVLVVSIDTLRADRLPLLPRVGAIVEEGALFTEAMSAAPWTLPSHASLFTSLLPFDHKAQWTHAPIRPRQLMLAELFQEAGYRTAAFTGGAYVSRGFGFDQGFEVYEDHDEALEGGSKTIFGNALAWIRRHRSSPFFLFVHTYEPHFPYHRAADVKLPPGRLGPVFTIENCEEVYRDELRLTPEERRYVAALYDSDVRSTDAAVGGFLETLRADGVLDDLILVVLSDHGEDLWDHVDIRSPGHGHSLYEELVHVPLALRAPGRVAAGLRLKTPVSLLDVAPTLLDLCQLPPSPRHQGRSLAEELRRGEEPEPRPLFAESIEHGPDRFALREGPLKVVLTPHPERVHMDIHLDVRPVEVFDLSVDPLERDWQSGRNHAEFQRAVRQLVDRATRVLPSRGKPAPGSHDLSDELNQQLRSLGYVN